MSSLSLRCEEAARQIADRVVQEAFWFEDRCNWIGTESSPRTTGASGAESTCRTLGPDLYTGTSGIALFLAELASVIGSDKYAHAANGAVRHAFRQAETQQTPMPPGLFNGSLGIVLAALRVASLGNDAELRCRALALLDRTLALKQEGGEFDLMSGDAGSVAALLTIEQMTGNCALIATARTFAERLMERAAKDNTGWSWQSPSLKTKRNLTGLSHGASGCGYALLELYQVTRLEAYWEASRQAFRYEQSCFDAKSKNWPDFRNGFDKRTKPVAPCLTFWCHGAPGIALTRLRAFDLSQANRYRSEAEIAVETTSRSIEAALEDHAGNFSLCHGLAGNGEVLLYANEVLGRDSERDTLLAGLAEYGIKQHLMSGTAWPCGTHSGETPNLMLGLAGIGHFYLRMAYPETPSVLLLRREQWAFEEVRTLRRAGLS